MEFNELKEKIKSILELFAENIGDVTLEDNDYVDDHGESFTIDGYAAIYTLLQKGFQSAMRQLYDEMPEDYEYAEDEEEECCCGHEHGDGCCCGEHHHHDDDCCCGEHHHHGDDCCCHHKDN